MEFMVYKAQIDPDLTSDLEVNYIGLVDRPAIERNFLAFDEAKKKLHFNVDTEKRIVSGPAMIADMPLYRRDNELGEYYVVFDKFAISTIAQKFAAKGYFTNLNLFHDPAQKTDSVVIYNSFISDSSIGVKPMTGFEDLAEGSWFITAKINDDAVWEKVKSGEIRGFSVEGLFTYLPAQTVKLTREMKQSKIDYHLDQIEKLLNETSTSN